ncbi:hypothetical protein [Nocardia farcinica]|uniref:hypothetical protein n=1 Tax=Nocardia farcinica TaxID=37329 RepID=UPI0018939E6D|nr:hypothetical protein [Nocardia farcinica]MBF6520441.1 hypothetical protein [Nocardia farcinica]
MTGTGRDHRADPRDVRAAIADSPDPLLAAAAGDERNVVPTPTRVLVTSRPARSCRRIALPHR